MRFAGLVGSLSFAFLASCGAPNPPAVSPSNASSERTKAAASSVAVKLPDYGYPATRTTDARDVLHGTVVADPYRWLEDPSTEDVKSWMRAQDDFARAKLSALPLRNALAARLAEIAYFEDVQLPVRRNDGYFFRKRDAKGEKYKLFVRDVNTGKERLLINPEAWAADGSASLGEVEVAPDGRKVAYTVHKNNSDEASLYVLDVVTGKPTRTDVIPGAKYAGIAWTRGSDAFYYVRVPEPGAVPVADRPGYAEVRFHRLGSDPASDPVVFERTGDAKTFLDVRVSDDGRFVIVTKRRGWSASDVFVQDLGSPKASKRAEATAWRALAQGNDATYEVVAGKDALYVLTNEGAPNRRLFRVTPENLSREAWTEVVSERPGVILEGVQLGGGRLIVRSLKDVAARVEVFDLLGKPMREVALPGLGTVGEHGISAQEGVGEAFVVFESFTQPREVFRYDIAKGSLTSFFRPRVAIDASAYAVTQEFAQSKDQTRVPYFIVAKKGLLDSLRSGAVRGAPVLLTGYGGFNVSMTSTFAAARYAWLERGGIFVQANLRGGNEYGEAWHTSGMGRSKQNVFDDMIAVAEHLVRQKYTSPEQLGAMGRSNGGLLMGAMLTQRPDLFRAIVCGVPLLDMVRYPLFGSGKTWMGEYGSPEVEADFRALFAYSPYHRVRIGTKYPSLLMMATDSDDRVDPMHARKFVAAVQNASVGGLALLRIERNAGHGGADLVRAMIEETADAYAFLFDQLGDPASSHHAGP